MSQAGSNSNTQAVLPSDVATSYVTDSGTAVPSAHVLHVLGDTGVSTSGSGSTVQLHSVMQSKTVTVTSAEIKSLLASPKEIIPAQGSGAITIVLNTTMKTVYGGTNEFTNAQSLAVNYTNAAGQNVMSGTTNILSDFPNSNGYGIFPQITGLEPLDTDAEDQPIVLCNQGMSEITGNAANDNTLVVQVLYYVLTI